MPDKQVNTQNLEAVTKELMDYASPKVLREAVTKMFITWSHTDNADCVIDRTQTSNVFGHLVSFFAQLEEIKK